MKRRLYEKRRWVWDIDEQEVQYDITAIVGAREAGELGRLYSVKWADGTETEEPMSSLVNVPEMVAEFENRPRGRGARKASLQGGKKGRAQGAV